MCQNYVKKVLPVFSILLMVLFNQPMKAHAFVDLHSERGHQEEKSREHGDDHRSDGDKRDGHQDGHQDEHHDEHHG